MNTLLKLIKWDFVIIYKYGIVAIATIITIIYCAALLFLQATGIEKIITLLIFSDPVMYGFLFTAIIILFDKVSRTNMALFTTPVTVMQYIISKAIVFTVLALTCSTAIILSAQPNYFNIIWFVAAVILSSVLFVFIGIIGVSFVNNFNQFILLMPIVLAPACLPFLSFFNVFNHWAMYLIPTQPCIILFSASVTYVNNWQIMYALLYLIFSIIITAFYANKMLLKQIKSNA